MSMFFKHLLRVICKDIITYTNRYLQVLYFVQTTQTMPD